MSLIENLRDGATREAYWLRYPPTSPVKLRWRAVTVRHSFHVLPGAVDPGDRRRQRALDRAPDPMFRGESQITAAVFNAELRCASAGAPAARDDRRPRGRPRPRPATRASTTSSAPRSCATTATPRICAGSLAAQAGRSAAVLRGEPVEPAGPPQEHDPAARSHDGTGLLPDRNARATACCGTRRARASSRSR